jgi:copper chaperone
MRRLTLQITGMSCGHCLDAVNQALSSKPGVTVESLQMGRAVVSYDEQTADPAAIENAVTEAGYAATATWPVRDGGIIG